MAEVIPQINIDGTKIKDTWTEKEYVTDEVYNALNKTVIDLKNNNNLLDSNSILFREEYNSSSKNLNNAIHQGVYSFTNSAVNAPSGVNGGNLLVTNTSKTNQGSSIITQIAFCHNGAVYARTKNTSENFTSWNKLAYITDNVASATKATQDKNGLQIDTNYLKRSGGTITGQLTMGTGPEVRIKAPNNTGFYFNSGALGCYNWSDTNGGSIFSYSPSSNTFTFGKNVTAPTPGTSDNSTRVATTAFVHSLLGQRGNTTASKATNGYWKDNNTGIIWQWGKAEIGNIDSTTIINFPIAFPNATLNITCTLLINNVHGSSQGSENIKTFSKTNFVYYSGTDLSSKQLFYYAVGY